MENKGFIIDVDIICYIMAHRMRYIESKEEVEQACKDYLVDLYSSLGTEEAYLCMTAHSLKRSEIYPEYKKTRKSSDMIWLKPIKDFFRQSSIIVDGYEADDLIFTIANELRSNGYHPVIVTNDKDMKQIPCTFIKTSNLESTEIDDLAAKKYWYTQLLMGDAVDNIPGISKVGITRATRIVEGDKINTVGDILNTYLQYGMTVRDFYITYELITLQYVEGDFNITHLNDIV